MTKIKIFKSAFGWRTYSYLVYLATLFHITMFVALWFRPEAFSSWALLSGDVLFGLGWIWRKYTPQSFKLGPASVEMQDRLPGRMKVDTLNGETYRELRELSDADSSASEDSDVEDETETK